MFRYSYLIMTLVLTISSCKKDPVYEPLNIDLRHSSFATITSNIKGNWDLRKRDVAGCLNCIKYNPGEYTWAFSSDGVRIKQVYRSVTITDTTLLWRWMRTLFGDTTYVMGYSDIQGAPSSGIVNKIRNDTLILMENAIDGSTYYFTKLP
jgi:hypothetical protein